jgi:hypothetical protein
MTAKEPDVMKDFSNASFPPETIARNCSVAQPSERTIQADAKESDTRSD